MYSAKNATLSMNGKTMDYVTFGERKGPSSNYTRLGDGLQTVKGKAQLFLSRIVYLLSDIKSMFFLESMS